MKTETNYTQGKWTINLRREGNRGFYVREIIGDGEPIADIRGADSIANDANARLIAAAPDLYAALKRSVELHDDPSSTPDDCEIALAEARDILARVEGGEE